jgi:hypothetical protein
MGGWVSGAVEKAMADKGWSGGCAVLFRKDDTGPIVMFHEGLVDPYDGVLPHGLVDVGLGHDSCFPWDAWRDEHHHDLGGDDGDR